MKYYSLFSLLALLNCGSSAFAASIFDIHGSIAAFADSVTASTGNYYDQNFVNFTVTGPTGNLASAVTGGDLGTYAWTPNAHLPASPAVDTPYIDLAFSNPITNSAGPDLALFFAGNGTQFQDGHDEAFLFSIMVDNQQTGLLGIDAWEYGIYGDQFPASYTLIDLTDLGFSPNAVISSDIRVFLGDSSMPALSALGAFNTTAVPLPPAALLLGSGLIPLLLLGRKKQA